MENKYPSPLAQKSTSGSVAPTCPASSAPFHTSPSIMRSCMDASSRPSVQELVPSPGSLSKPSSTPNLASVSPNPNASSEALSTLRPHNAHSSEPNHPTNGPLFSTINTSHHTLNCSKHTPPSLTPPPVLLTIRSSSRRATQRFSASGFLHQSSDSNLASHGCTPLPTVRRRKINISRSSSHQLEPESRSLYWNSLDKSVAVTSRLFNSAFPVAQSRNESSNMESSNAAFPNSRRFAPECESPENETDCQGNCATQHPVRGERDKLNNPQCALDYSDVPCTARSAQPVLPEPCHSRSQFPSMKTSISSVPVNLSMPIHSDTGEQNLPGIVDSSPLTNLEFLPNLEYLKKSPVLHPVPMNDGRAKNSDPPNSASLVPGVSNGPKKLTSERNVENTVVGTQASLQKSTAKVCSGAALESQSPTNQNILTSANPLEVDSSDIKTCASAPMLENCTRINNSPSRPFLKKSVFCRLRKPSNSRKSPGKLDSGREDDILPPLEEYSLTTPPKVKSSSDLCSPNMVCNKRMRIEKKDRRSLSVPLSAMPSAPGVSTKFISSSDSKASTSRKSDSISEQTHQPPGQSSPLQTLVTQPSTELWTNIARNLSSVPADFGSKQRARNTVESSRKRLRTSENDTRKRANLCKRSSRGMSRRLSGVRWTRDETRALLECIMKPCRATSWEVVSERMQSKGFGRSQHGCHQHYSGLLSIGQVPGGVGIAGMRHLGINDCKLKTSNLNSSMRLRTKKRANMEEDIQSSSSNESESVSSEHESPRERIHEKSAPAIEGSVNLLERLKNSSFEKETVNDENRSISNPPESVDFDGDRDDDRGRRGSTSSSSSKLGFNQGLLAPAIENHSLDQSQPVIDVRAARDGMETPEERGNVVPSSKIIAVHSNSRKLRRWSDKEYVALLSCVTKPTRALDWPMVSDRMVKAGYTDRSARACRVQFSRLRHNRVGSSSIMAEIFRDRSVTPLRGGIESSRLGPIIADRSRPRRKVSKVDSISAFQRSNSGSREYVANIRAPSTEKNEIGNESAHRPRHAHQDKVTISVLDPTSTRIKPVPKPLNHSCSPIKAQFDKGKLAFSTPGNSERDVPGGCLQKMDNCDGATKLSCERRLEVPLQSKTQERKHSQTLYKLGNQPDVFSLPHFSDTKDSPEGLEVVCGPVLRNGAERIFTSRSAPKSRTKEEVGQSVTGSGAETVNDVKLTDGMSKRLSNHGDEKKSSSNLICDVLYQKCRTRHIQDARTSRFSLSSIGGCLDLSVTRSLQKQSCSVEDRGMSEIALTPVGNSVVLGCDSRDNGVRPPKQDDIIIEVDVSEYVGAADAEHGNRSGYSHRLHWSAISKSSDGKDDPRSKHDSPKESIHPLHLPSNSVRPKVTRKTVAAVEDVSGGVQGGSKAERFGQAELNFAFSAWNVQGGPRIRGGTALTTDPAAATVPGKISSRLGVMDSSPKLKQGIQQSINKCPLPREPYTDGELGPSTSCRDAVDHPGRVAHISHVPSIADNCVFVSDEDATMYTKDDTRTHGETGTVNCSDDAMSGLPTSRALVDSIPTSLNHGNTDDIPLLEVANLLKEKLLKRKGHCDTRHSIGISKGLLDRDFCGPSVQTGISVPVVTSSHDVTLQTVDRETEKGTKKVQGCHFSDDSLRKTMQLGGDSSTFIGTGQSITGNEPLTPHMTYKGPTGRRLGRGALRRTFSVPETLPPEKGHAIEVAMGVVEMDNYVGSGTFCGNNLIPRIGEQGSDDEDEESTTGDGESIGESVSPRGVPPGFWDPIDGDGDSQISGVSDDGRPLGEILF